MKLFQTNFLSYSPEDSWQLNSPQIYFNRDFLAEGEPFKVRVNDYNYSYFRQDMVLSIERIESDLSIDAPERRETILSGVSLRRPSSFLGPPFMLAVGTGKEGALSPGLYVAEISSNIRGLDSGSVPLNEHRFYVADTREYYNQWQYLFGDTWDEPIFWDDMSAASGRDLISGLPLEDFLAVTRNGIRWDGETFFEFLGPIITIFMMNGFREARPLPFRVRYLINEHEVETLPHIDLTKLVWFLSVLGPIFADLSFFSYGIELATRINREGLFVDMQWDGPYFEMNEHYLSKNVDDFYLPSMFRVVKESIGSEMNYQMKYENNRLRVSVFSA